MEVLKAQPRSYQVETLEKLAGNNFVSLRSPRGCGKTVVASWAALWAVCCFPDVKVVTTALAWTQLKRFLWPEIHKWVARSDLTSLGFELVAGEHLQSQAFTLSANRTAFAVASKEGARLEGFHADLVLFILDEAKKIPDEIWRSILTGSLGNEFKTLAVSTPGLPVGMFYETQTGKAENWRALHVTKDIADLEVPFFREQANQLKRQFGEDSVPYRQHVLGEFAQDDEDSLIPLHLIEAANVRWLERKNNPSRLLYRLGVDVGGTGGSNSVIATRYSDNWIDHLGSVQSSTDMTDKTLFGIRTILAQNRGRIHGDARIIIDGAGVGMGVSDGAKDLSVPVDALYVSSATKELDTTGTFGFNNVRTLLLWRLYEGLNPDITPEDRLICLPPDDELTGELVAIKKIQQASGFKAEGKAQIKRRIGRSPDKADAVMLSMAEPVGIAKMKQQENPWFQ